MPKLLKGGGEVDSWCTKCRLVLNHRIIAMVGSKPARVECSTCGSHHNYRARAPGDPAEKATSTPKERTARESAAPSARSKSAGIKRAEQERVDLEKTWEKAISGKGVRDFKAYRISGTFQHGELVRHTKFGDGVVMRIVDAHKVEILFKAEAKILAQGMAE